MPRRSHISRAESGASIVESMFVMMILLLVLFGVLQVFQLFAAQLFTEYSAFRAARSVAVGFNDSLATREALVTVAAVSGDLVAPEKSTKFGSTISQFTRETFLLEKYMEGTQRARYEFWNGEPLRHFNWHCPSYGKPLIGRCDRCCSTSSDKAAYYAALQRLGDTVRADIRFQNYPLRIPLHEVFLRDKSLDLKGSITLTNHSETFLE